MCQRKYEREKESLTLWISKSVPNLILTKFAILEARPVLSNSLHHELLVLFTKAMRFHRRIRHPPDDERTPKDGDNSISHEERLPRFDRTRNGDMREAKCKETAKHLLEPIHHIPEYDGAGLLFPLVPHS